MTVTLKDFELYELHYVPHQRHSFMINDSRKTVENYHSGEFANHIILQCRTTGIVLDLTLGQLTGEMKPAIFASYQDYEAALPGRILKKILSNIESLRQQVGTLISTRMPPDFSPLPFGERVLRQAMKEKSPYCALCLGTASSPDVDLKRCAACKEIFYCAKTCQALHWKEHKKVCTGRATKKGT